MSRLFLLGFFVAVVLPGCTRPQECPVPDDLASTPVATFSILGHDPETGEVGGAVQSRVFSVGSFGDSSVHCGSIVRSMSTVFGLCPLFLTVKLCVRVCLYSAVSTPLSIRALINCCGRTSPVGATSTSRSSA